MLKKFGIFANRVLFAEPPAIVANFDVMADGEMLLNTSIRELALRVAQKHSRNHAMVVTVVDRATGNVVVKTDALGKFPEGPSYPSANSNVLSFPATPA